MHYVIVGNGVAGIEAAFAIRRRWEPSHATITVISDESDYFFSRTALMYAYMNKMRRRDLEPYERKVYERRHIDLKRGRVVDLDANQQALRLESGETVDYDRLLLAVGAKPRMVPWPGLDEVDDGVVNMVSMQDLDACERLTPSTDRAVVVGGGLIGVELCECLDFHGVDVTFLVREPYFWPAGLDREEGQMIAEHIRSHGIDLRLKEELEEVVPDPQTGRVAGVRTDQNEEIPCQMLGIAIGVTPNIDWLEEVSTPPRTRRGILVDRSFRTSLPNVWAAGDCCEIEMAEDDYLQHTIWYSAKRWGRLAGESMLGDDLELETRTFFNSAKFFDIEYTTVGDITTAEDGTRTLFRTHPDEPICQRIAVDERERVTGFNMLGSRWEHTVLRDWVRQRRPLDWVLERLDQAQFDVEFGRADLAAMNEQWQTL